MADQIFTKEYIDFLSLYKTVITESGPVGPAGTITHSWPITDGTINVTIPSQPAVSVQGKFSTAHLLRLLENNICNIVFTKMNGDIRVMRCTTNLNRFAQNVGIYTANTIPFSHGTTSSNTSNPAPVDTIRVWDLDKNGWRSFKASSVQMVEIDPEDLFA